MLSQLVICALVLPCVGTSIQSWPSWKKEYKKQVAGKSAYVVKVINQQIEGSTAPTETAKQPLWSWLSQVTDGTEKTEAQSLMQKTFSDLGGESSLISDFISKVAVEFSTRGDPQKAYTKVYWPITNDAKLKDSDDMYFLNLAYQSMSSEQKTSVASALEKGLGGEWDKKSKLITSWKADPKVYKDMTDAAMDIVGLGTVTDTTTASDAKGTTCYAAYAAAVKNSDKTAVAFFDRKIATALATALA